MNKKYIIEVCSSLLIALIFAIITYWTMNFQIPISSEKVQLQFFEALRQYYWPQKSSNMEESVILIDTHYDQQFLMEKEIPDMTPIGLVPATDREKLLKCLEILKRKNDYKYILLDIFLDKAVQQDSDSTLFKTIASMPRIVIAKPQDIPLAAPCLEPKSGTVQYKIALWENDFVKYPFTYKGEKSLPLMMYEDITNRTITKKGPFYWDNGLARNCVILTYDNLDFNELTYLGGTEDFTINDALKDSEGKYILIGDFVDDLHNTFIGKIPGTLINFNAFLSLYHGHHIFGFGIILFIIFIFAIPIYLKITNHRIPAHLIKDILQISVIKRNVLHIKEIMTKRKKKKIYEFLRKTCLFLYIILSKLFSSWVGYPLYLTIVCFFTYIVFNEAYDILITTTLFYIFNIIWDAFRKINIKTE